MFKYDCGKVEVGPMGINHKFSPSQGWDGEPCLAATVPTDHDIIPKTRVWEQCLNQPAALLSSFIFLK